jgi:tripartite-type tricarboxylate transporter receptor subunit TctC
MSNGMLRATVFAAAMVVAGSHETHAQTYPQKPVRIIVPSAAGGPTDIPGRLVADGLSRLTGQRFIIENRVSAGGTSGAELVAKSEPNGYTLLYANTSVLAVNPAFQDKLPYDAGAFVPIGFVSNSHQVLVVYPKFPAKSIKELLAYAKANPGKVNFATRGLGTLPHLTYELFKLETGISATMVNYKGGGPALIAVLAGEADMMFDIVGSRIHSGEVKALAVTGASRHPDIPDVPTMAEAGLPAMTSTSGTGLVGPAGTPRDVVRLLNGMLNELIQIPDVQSKMKALGLTPAGGTPEDFGAWANEQRQKWTLVVKQAGLRSSN